MKETTSSYIDGLVVGGSITYMVLTVAKIWGWNVVFMVAGVLGFSYCMLLIALAADQERKWRRKNYEKGTHDYYGNKVNDKE